MVQGWLPDWEAVTTQLGGNDVTALITGAGEGQDGHSVTWNNSGSEFTLTDIEASIPGGSNYTVTTQSGSTYDLVLGDAQSLIIFTYNGGVQISLPTNAEVAFPIGTRIRLAKTGTVGNANVFEDVATTLHSLFGSPAVSFDGVGELIKIDTDEWMFTGDILNDS